MSPSASLPARTGAINSYRALNMGLRHAAQLHARVTLRPFGDALQGDANQSLQQELVGALHASSETIGSTGHLLCQQKSVLSCRVAVIEECSAFGCINHSAIG